MRPFRRDLNNFAALTVSPTSRTSDEKEDGQFMRTFSLIADETPMLFMISYVISRGYELSTTLTLI